MTTNDAAERLRFLFADDRPPQPHRIALLDEALAQAREQERERIRAGIDWSDGPRDFDEAIWRSAVLDILDAENGEDAESNHPNAEWNR